MAKFYKMAKCIFSWPAHFKNGQIFRNWLWNSQSGKPGSALRLSLISQACATATVQTTIVSTQYAFLLCTESTSAVVLNRGYTYHLGVRGAKAGGTKHQSLQGYKLWKFKPDFIEHSSWFSVVWRTIIHSLGLVRYTLRILYLACLHSKSAVA